VLGIGFIILCCFSLEFSCWNACVRFMFIVLLFCVVCAVWVELDNYAGWWGLFMFMLLSLCGLSLFLFIILLVVCLI